MKRIFICLVLALTFLILPLGITGCGNSQKPLSTQEFYAMGLATGATFLNSKQQQPASVLQNSIEHKTTIESYMGLFGGLINSGIHPTMAQTSQDDGTYATSYQKKLSINIEQATFVMYYNEVNLGSQIEPDEKETATFISGIAISGTNEYFVKGGQWIESEIEQGQNEVETELRFIISDKEINVTGNKIETAMPQTDSNYIIIEEESESDEYEYSYVRSDDKLNPVSIEWENEKGREKLELEIGTIEYEITKFAENEYKIIKKVESNITTYYMEKQGTGYIYKNQNGEEI